MLKTGLFLSLFLLTKMIYAQSTQRIYMLEGVMETAAGFRLLDDQTFEYFFSYGAADKWGKGTWKKEGEKIVFSSFHTQPPTDFSLKESHKYPGNTLRIKVCDSTGNPYRYVSCLLNEQERSTDESGIVEFELDSARFLRMYHPIFSIRLTSIHLPESENDFIIMPTCDLSEVFFNNVSFVEEEDEISATVLPGSPDQPNGTRTFHFKKSQ